MITAIQPTSHAFADLEPFPPPPGASGSPPPPGAPSLNFAITFESSGKWPDDLRAIASLKTAFYLRLATLIEEQGQLLCEVRHDTLHVQMDGFVFSGVIHHAGTSKLLEASGDWAAADAMRWRTDAGARHVSSLSALGRTHPAYPPSVRLAKRWLASQRCAFRCSGRTARRTRLRVVQRGGETPRLRRGRLRALLASPRLV